MESIDIDGTPRLPSNTLVRSGSRDEEIFGNEVEFEDPSNSIRVDGGMNNEQASSDGSNAAPNPSGWISCISWLALLIAVFSMSAVGPMFLWLEKAGVPPILAIVWRQITQTLFLIPPTIIEHWMAAKDGKVKWWNERVKDHLEPEEEARKAAEALKRRRTASAMSPNTPTQMTRIDVAEFGASDGNGAEGSASQGSHPMKEMFITSLHWSLSVSLWVIALPFTSAARASLFSSLYPLMIMAYMRFWRKMHVSADEFVGVVVCRIIVNCCGLERSSNEG